MTLANSAGGFPLDVGMDVGKACPFGLRILLSLSLRRGTKSASPNRRFQWALSRNTPPRRNVLLTKATVEDTNTSASDNLFIYN